MALRKRVGRQTYTNVAPVTYHNSSRHRRLHSTDEETEDAGGEVTLPRSHT